MTLFMQSYLQKNYYYNFNINSRFKQGKDIHMIGADGI